MQSASQRSLKSSGKLIEQSYLLCTCYYYVHITCTGGDMFMVGGGVGVMYMCMCGMYMVFM